MKASALVVPSGFIFPANEIATFCQRWGIGKLELFGSATRTDFNSDSDIDFLVTFESELPKGLLFLDMQEELETILGRKVDILTRKSVENSRNKFKKNKILTSAMPIYE